MPRAPGPAKPRKRAATPKVAAKAPGAGAGPAVVKVAVPVAPEAAKASKRSIDEPVWLVRIVLLLFLVGFAAFLAREVYSFAQALG